MEPVKSPAWNTVSEIELIYRSKVKPSERPRLLESKAVHELLISHWEPNRIELVEEAKAILMNRSHRVLALFDLSSGGISGTVVDPRLLLIAALKLNANTIILAHNHPSGSLQPSEQDKILTQKVKQAGLLLDMQLVDHIIVTKEGYYSFADEGVL